MILDYYNDEVIYLDELRHRVEVGIDEIAEILPEAKPKVVMADGGLLYLEVALSDNLLVSYFLEAHGEYNAENLRLMVLAIA